uniref:hypothetical protein n=1 Tax=Shewanella sp. TaxID=50422 RepID=UPI003563C9F6
DWGIKDCNGRLIAQFEPLSDDISNCNTDESFANAHLIAAAPEMYKMLECHLAAWSNLYPSDISDIDDMHKSEFEPVHKFISKTKELLDKARGE